MSEESPKKEKKSYQEKNKKLFKDKSLLQEEWMECLSKPDALVFSWFFPCCVMPINCGLASDKNARCLNMIAVCCCGCPLCGLQRSHIQKAVGVEDDGLVWNCLMHVCCCVSPCSLVQEYKAVIRWKKATNDSFKGKWKDSGKNWWDAALITLQNLDMD